jgi:hypothetical protein
LTPVPPVIPPPTPKVEDWFLAVLVNWSGALAVFFVGRKVTSLRWGVRWCLMSAAGGLLAYTYMVSGLPGSSSWFENLGRTGVVLVSLVGIVVGLSAGLLWKNALEQRARIQASRRL